MKIAFICGCLESGKDGVGDYSTRLALQLSKSGHEVLLLAINDYCISEIHKSSIESGSSTVQILRIPANTESQQVKDKITTELKDFKPDWISFQFVLFAFDTKGLPFGISKLFKEICQGIKVHVMFHELWLGMGAKSGIKYKLWGYFQERIVLKFLKTVNARIINTHSFWYAKQLKQLNLNVSILPLFSNIPIAFPENLQSKKPFSGNASDEKIDFVLFGHISLHSPVDDFVNELKAWSTLHNKKIKLTFIGRNNSDKDRWSNAWSNKGFEVANLGILPAEKVSEILMQSDIGIATTPVVLIEKSGSFMAMMEHGLPVINVSDIKELEDELSEMVLPIGLVQYRTGKLDELLTNLKAPTLENKLESTAKMFISSLENFK